MIGDDWQTPADELWELKVKTDALKAEREAVMAKKRGLALYLVGKGLDEVNSLGTDSRFGLKIQVKYKQPSTMSILEPVLVEFMRAHDNRLPTDKELKAALKQKKIDMRGPPIYDLRWIDAQADLAKKDKKLRKALKEVGYSENAVVVDGEAARAVLISQGTREASQPVSL